MADDTQEKTEQPSRKKLEEARKKGQIPRSRDLALAAASIAATIALVQFGGRIVDRLGNRLARDLSHFGDSPLRVITTGDVSALVTTHATLLALLVGPIAAATLVAGVGMHGFQGGWSFSFSKLQLNWSRLNPASNVRKFGFQSNGMDTIKTLLTVAVIGYLGYQAVVRVVNDSLRMPWIPPMGAAHAASSHVQDLLWDTTWALLAIAVADYAWQRYRVMSQLKMSKQELRDEAKESEGSAEVKGRVRRIQRDMARRRMLNDVPRATVVIANPTHFAVALEYKRDRMAAPVVLAKGQDHLALRIRERARQHGIPIVENKPLAQTLFRTAEVGDTIPGPLFAAVAEVLAQLIRLKQLSLN
jgi:flagellar biosynthetic protein FlhB